LNYEETMYVLLLWVNNKTYIDLICDRLFSQRLDVGKTTDIAV